MLVLADVESPGRDDARDFAIHHENVRHVARTDRLHHRVEGTLREHRQICHRRLHRAQLETALGGDGAIAFEHRGTQIHHRHLRAGCGEERAMFSAARCQAQDAPAPHVAAEPTERVGGGERIAEVRIARALRMRIAAAHPLIPGLPVVFEKRGHAAAQHRNLNEKGNLSAQLWLNIRPRKCCPTLVKIQDDASSEPVSEKRTGLGSVTCALPDPKASLTGRVGRRLGKRLRVIRVIVEQKKSSIAFAHPTRLLSEP